MGARYCFPNIGRSPHSTFRQTAILSTAVLVLSTAQVALHDDGYECLSLNECRPQSMFEAPCIRGSLALTKSSHWQIIAGRWASIFSCGFARQGHAVPVFCVWTICSIRRAVDLHMKVKRFGGYNDTRCFGSNSSERGQQRAAKHSIIYQKAFMGLISEQQHKSSNCPILSTTSTSTDRLKIFHWL